ncbi:MAG: DUF503 domain-containing protein [Candidatus Aegiribacteria sp.]|nr:DUF503 domain-containing protein [Candidatus Aegiribacteria sp.]
MKNERTDTLIGFIRVELYFRGCRTLKDRRGFLRSLKDRLSNMGFSVAQVGPPNIIQRAWIAAVCISGTETGASRMLNRAEKLMYNPEWELISIDKDIITDGELSEMEEHY